MARCGRRCGRVDTGYDITKIVPERKRPGFRKGQIITEADIRNSRILEKSTSMWEPEEQLLMRMKPLYGWQNLRRPRPYLDGTESGRVNFWLRRRDYSK